MKRSFADIMAGLDSERAQKVARKLPAWAAVDGLEIPSALALEQCSSSATAAYKAFLAGQAAAAARSGQLPPETSGYAGPLPSDDGPLPLTMPPDKDKSPWKGAQGVEGQASLLARFQGAVPASVPLATILDLTGGLGVDSWAFAQVAERVVYFERNEELAAAAGRNFQRLGAGNIDVRCETVTPQTELPEADLIYADPARRDAAGRKVFLLEDCTPDILTLLPMLLKKAPAVLVKLSPMADLAMLAERLGPALREIHVVECDGEVKELLCLLLRDNSSPEPEIVIARLSGQAATVAKLRASRYPSQADAWAPPVHEATGGHGFATVPPAPAEKAHNTDRLDDSNMVSGAVGRCVKQGGDLRFRMSEERVAEAAYAAGVQPGDVLLEPCPALLKAGAFRLPCTRWALRKLAPSTHLYLLPADSLSGPNNRQSEPPYGQSGQFTSHSGLDPESLPAPGTKSPQNVPGSQDFDLPGTKHGQNVPGNRFFKAWRIVEVLPFGAAALKALKKRYPRADVTARNLPLGSAELQKRLGVASGGDVHIFGCRLADGSSVLLVTEQA